MTKMLLILLVAVVIVGGCGSDPTSRATGAKPPVDTFTLTVKVTDGVTGSPAAGAIAYPSEASVKYSFSATSGYQGLSVLVDGDTAAATGTLRMDRDHTLGALANPTPVVPSTAKPQVDQLAQQYRGMLNGTLTAMQAYRGIQSAVTSLAAKVPLDSLPRLLALGSMEGYSPSDAPAIARALREISDSLTGSPVSVAGGHVREERASGVSPDVIFLYVNGIWTDAGDLLTTFTQFLPQTLADAGYGDRSRYSVQTYYNPGSTVGDINALGSLICFSHEAAAVREGAKDVSDRCAEYAGATLLNGDLGQAFGQAVLQTAAAPATSLTARGIAGAITKDLGSAPVVVIAHSQGNLQVNAAFRLLEADPTINPRCIGTVALAPPVPITPIRGGFNPTQMFVTGNHVKDVLLLVEDLKPGTLPGATSVNSSTNLLSDVWNKTYETLSNFWLGLLSGGWASTKALEVLAVGSIDLHSINNDYLTAHRGVVAAAIREQVGNVFGGCVPAVASVSVTPATATITPGGMVQLTATAMDAAGRVIPAGAVGWTSSYVNGG